MKNQSHLTLLAMSFLNIPHVIKFRIVPLAFLSHKKKKRASYTWEKQYYEDFLSHNLSSLLPLFHIVLTHGEGILQIMMVDCLKSFLQTRKVVEDELKFLLRCH
jgi:hypothetical protein